MHNKRIAITGLGPVSSIGIGKEAFWQSLLAKRTNIKKERCLVNGELWGEYYTHKLEHFDLQHFGIDAEKFADITDWKEGEQIPDLNYLIAAIKLALDDAGFDFAGENNGLGLVLAHENLGVMPFGMKVSDLAYQLRDQPALGKKEYFDRLYRGFFKSGYDIQVFADLFHISRMFNIREYSLFINNACASGLYALESASQIIKCGQARSVVVAISDYPDIYKYLWFHDLGIYAPDGIIRPFAKNSKGLCFGDGGIGVLLEDLASAQARGAPIYAEYLGGGFDLEGWRITMPQIGSDSYQTAIRKALAHSGKKKEEIELLCPHGVGSQPIDYYEAKALNDIFGTHPRQPLISAFKPYIGHTLGASALFETTILLLSLKYGIIPATLNGDAIDPRFNISLVTETTKKQMHTAMKTCCAFAGYNAAAVFQTV